MYVLTAWRYLAGMLLAALLALALLWDVVRGWRQRRTVRGRDVLFLLGLTLIPAVWVLILPSHTLMHASFMVRMMVVPISLALAALVWPSNGEAATS
jgi:hypothetical protein